MRTKLPKLLSKRANLQNLTLDDVIELADNDIYKTIAQSLIAYVLYKDIMLIVSMYVALFWKSSDATDA
jgi:hypothetical protein